MPTLPTEIRRHLDAIRRAVRAHGLWQPQQRVLVAVSGGRDSMALLGLLDVLRPSLKHTLVVAHVDHGLQPNHLDMAAVVQAEAVRRGLPHVHAAIHVRPGADLEARAREARYAALAKLQAQTDSDVMATAHHADDQAETLLMRLARGAGPDAQAGVRRRRGTIVRPVLALTRADLATCAAWLQVPWVEDPSNALTDHTRNRLRHEVLPALTAAMPDAAVGLARSATLAAMSTGALHAWLDQLLWPHVVHQPGTRVLAIPQTLVPPLPAARAALLGWVAQRLHVPTPSTRATAQWLALGPNEQADFRQFSVRGDGQTWHFIVFDIAHPHPAD